MLKTYTKLEDVPEALREHYKQIDGKFVPEISDDHPVKVNNVQLLNEKTTAETKAAGLESENKTLKADLDSAKSHSLPRGHRAVPVSEVEAMEKLKEHGAAAEIVTKLEEHKTLKTESAERKKQDDLRAVAKELSFNEALMLQLANLPEFESRDKDGKKIWIAKVKDGEKIIEKDAKDYFEQSRADVLPQLKTQSSGISVPGQMPDGGGAPIDVFKASREFAKNFEETGAVPNLARQRFGLDKQPAAQ